MKRYRFDFAESRSFIVVSLLALVLVVLYLWIRSRGGLLECFKKAVCKDTPRVPEDHRRSVPAIINRPALTDGGYYQNIPKVIYQTNERSMIPEGMYHSCLTILKDNPEYSYFYFDDASARDYLAKNFSARILKAYDDLIPGAYKADLFRYCILYKLGGVYIDTGMVSENSLRECLKSDDTFVSPEDDGTAGVYNAFMACIPRHPVVEAAILNSLENIEKRSYGSNPLAVTGPVLLADALKSVVGDFNENDRVPQPNTSYSNGIRIIRYSRTGFCTTEGEIYDGDQIVLTTRYPSYHIDRNWYNTNKHYSELWRAGKIFVTPETKAERSLANHQRSLMDLFRRFIEVSNEHALQWWATGGTLLGAIRENNMIPWDDDIDIEAPSETIEKLKMLNLRSKGLELSLDDHIWRLKNSGSSGKGATAIHDPYIDIFEVEQRPSTFNKPRLEWRYVDPVCNERWPDSFFYDDELFPLKIHKFGDLEINVAKIPEPYLKRQYKDWKTPVKEKGHIEFH